MIRSLGRVWLAVALIAACAFGCTGGGSGGGGGGDDDDDDDDGAGDVSVTIGESPTAGIAITVCDDQGAVLSQHVSDGSGEASFVVPDGGSFAVYFDDSETGGSPDVRRVIHVLDPAPGTQWSLPFPDSAPFFEAGYVDVTLSPVPAGANYGFAHAPCSSSANVLGFFLDELLASCDGSTTVPEIVGLAYATGGNLEGWGVATNVAVTPGGATSSVTIDASNTSFEQATFTFADVPIDYRSWTLLRLSTDHVELAFEVNNYGPGQSQNLITLTAPMGLTTRGYLEYEVRTDDLVGTPGEHLGAAVWGPLAAVTGSSSVASFPLARVTLSTPDLSAPARPSVAWVRGAGTTGAVGHLEITAENATAGEVFHHVLFAPDSLSSNLLVLPAVPDELSDWRPANVSNVDVTFEESGDLASRFAAFVDSAPQADGTYRFASGTFEAN